MKLNIQKFASGSFEFSNWTGNYAIRGKIEWSSTSSIETNTSAVTASIYVRRTSGYTTGKLWNGYVNIGGNNHTYSQIYTGTSTTVRQDWVLVQTFSDTISHNADGTKTINISGQVTGPSGTGLEGKSSWGDSDVTLDTIPRASTPTLSSASVDMGNSVTITTNRVSNSFTHTISYSFGSATGTIATNVGDSTTWTPPVTLASQIPSATSGTCVITCQTYNSGTLIGTKTVNLTLNVPSSVVPSVSIGTIAEANATMISLNWGVYVQNKSQLSIPITASGSYSSTITSVVTTLNGTTYTGTSVTTGFLTASGTNTISVTATDSRGRTNTATTTCSVVAYSAPTITTAYAVRGNSNGDEDDEGTYIKYTFNGSISPVSNNNSHLFRIWYKLKSAGSYGVNDYFDIDTSNYSITKTGNLNASLSTSDAYDIKFEAKDSFSTTTLYRDINTGFDLMNFNASGKAMAIGKVSQAGVNDKLLEIAMNTNIDGNVDINSNSSLIIKKNGNNILRNNATGATILSSAGTTDKAIWFRPNGDSDTSNQANIDTSGKFKQTSGGKEFSSYYDSNYYWKLDTDAGEFQFNKQVVGAEGFYADGGNLRRIGQSVTCHTEITNWTTDHTPVPINSTIKSSYADYFFTINSNNVTIKDSSVHHVLVSYNVRYDWNVDTGIVYYTNISQNNNIDWATHYAIYKANNIQYGVSFSPKVYSVSQNDYFTVDAWSQSNITTSGGTVFEFTITIID